MQNIYKPNLTIYRNAVTEGRIYLKNKILMTVSLIYHINRIKLQNPDDFSIDEEKCDKIK